VAEQGNSKVVILDSEFQVVASAGKEIAGKDLSGSELVTQIQKGENFETEIDGERFNVMAVKSEYNGWYYVSFISIDEVLRDFQNHPTFYGSYDMPLPGGGGYRFHYGFKADVPADLWTVSDDARLYE